MTGFSLQQKVFRERKRPTETSTNARIVRPVFGDAIRKKLWIPTVIDEYNHNMNGIDQANQLRASMSISRPREHRVWIPMWQFCFEISTVNAFLCWRFGRSSKHRLHRTFRLELINALLDYPLESEAIGRVPEGLNNWPGHQWSKFPKRNYCK